MDRRVVLSSLILCSLLVPVSGQRPQQPPPQSSAPKQQNPPREDEQDIVRITTNLVQVFIDKQLQPNDLVAIIRTGGDIGALQQFTTDKRLLIVEDRLAKEKQRTATQWIDFEVVK